MKAEEKIRKEDEENEVVTLMKEVAAEYGIKTRLLAGTIRYALTGKESGLPLHIIIEVLGREKTLERIYDFITYLRIEDCKNKIFDPNFIL